MTGGFITITLPEFDGTYDDGYKLATGTYELIKNNPQKALLVNFTKPHAPVIAYRYWDNQEDEPFIYLFIPHNKDVTYEYSIKPNDTIYGI